MPKTIRFDDSDTNVFTSAEEPGVWAVTGTFCFADADFESLSRKNKLAYSSGWLGTKTFGWSTFVQVTTIEDEQFDALVSRLSGYLMDQFNAPDLFAAINAARDEALYTSECCDHPDGTLLAIEREMTENGIAERVKAIPPEKDSLHSKIFDVVPEAY